MNQEFGSGYSSEFPAFSAGEDNRFGHPHDEVLARAEAVGAAVLRTDELVTIAVTSDRQAMTWQAGH